ncbi:hypothetical protein [uncultured Klebsiella sp.]|uniref:AAA family ATPase n=1 Tax=uncultured Klebsiella sp. TaxID=284011 RepID=UPI0028060B55|nr:hypothetical protein [uncultured Klebsiella sp.]
MSDVMVSSGTGSDERQPAFAAFVHSDSEARGLRDALARLKHPDAPVQPGGIAAAKTWCELNLPPRILLVDLDGEAWPLPALETLLAICGPGCQVIATGAVQDIGLYRSLLQLGVSDYLVKPYTLDLLSATLAKCAGQQAGPEYARLGRTVAVTGASGGVGASTVALGLSRLLSAERHLPVALVDFDRRHGDQLLLLGQSDDAGLAAVLASDELDTRLLQRAMLRVDTRLHVLAQKPTLNIADAVEVDAVLNLGGALCRMFNQVVWDLPCAFPSGALDVLTYADLRIVVTELTVQDARNVRRILHEIGDESEGQRLLLVHNQSHFHAHPPLPRDEFEHIVGRAIDVTLPHAGGVLAKSLAMGALDIASSPPWLQGLRQLADLACGQRPEPVKKRWLSSLLRRG